MAPNREALMILSQASQHNPVKLETSGLNIIERHDAGHIRTQFSNFTVQRLFVHNMQLSESNSKLISSASASTDLWRYVLLLLFSKKTPQYTAPN